MKVVAVFLLFLALGAAPAHAGLREGIDAYDQQDYVRAEKDLKPAAEAGSAAAQFLLGEIYRLGLALPAVPQDVVRAAHWYEKAAEGGHAAAQVQLGDLYRYGNDFESNKELAAYWYRKAADQHNAVGLNRLGVFYDWGDVKESDHPLPPGYPTTTALYRKAAEQGYAPAICNLGKSYQEAKGVTGDATRDQRAARDVHGGGRERRLRQELRRLR